MYNKEQEEVIKSKEPHILVNAGPGTGKTYTLIEAIHEHVRNNQGDQVVLISFTNVAADEMQERVKTQVNFCGTLHKLAMQEINTLSNKYGFAIRFLSKEMIKDIVLEVINESFSLNDRQVRDCVFYITDRNSFNKSKRKKLPIYDRINRDYLDYKKEINGFDFTDSPTFLLEKLKEYDTEIYYDSLFVDECQDLSNEQLELLTYFKTKKTFFIGDPDQSIYQFRGASGDIFDDLKKMGYKEYKLQVNYRSKKEILDFVGSGLTADRGEGGHILHSRRELVKAMEKDNTMILCRNNMEVDTIKQFYANVITVHAAKGKEYDNVIVCKFRPTTDEELNITFVALTRARDTLGVFSLQDIVSVAKELEVTLF